MRLLKSKHQRLILQCYPPGKNVDKKPNPSELSYLLYYATTRRTKLLKVGVFLQKKVISDYNHNRSGNLMVSIDIIRGLIDKCAENLDAFAENLMVIFKRILMTKDLALCQYLLPVFANFCKEISSDIFSGDLEFIEKFEDVCMTFVAFGHNPIAPNETEWKVLSLQSIRGFSPTLAYNNGLTETLVNYSMPLILSNVYDIGKPDADAQLGLDGTNELRKLATIKQVATTHSTAQDNSAVLANNVEDESYRALNSLFDTTSNSTGNQLQNSSNALIDYIVAHKVSIHWANNLMQLSVSWIPVSSRFKFLDSLFQKLSSSTDKQTKAVLTEQVGGLLSSSVTLISLDVPGTLKLLCREQLSIITDDITSVEDDLVSRYRDCIKSLTAHLYYRNQVSDIISNLLKECADIYDRYPIRGKMRNKVLVLFANIDALLRKAENDATDSVALEIWEDTFSYLFSDDDALIDYYSRLLVTYLNAEVKNPDAYRKPNFNKYISNQFNTLGQFFQDVNDYLQSANTSSQTILNALVTVSNKLIARYGINTIANGLPFFFEWQLKDIKNATDADKAKDTFAYIFIYESSKFLELPQFEADVLSKVNFRLHNALLVPSIYEFPEIDEIESANPFITREQIIDYTSGQSLLSSWLSLDAKSHQKEDYNSILNFSLSKQSSVIALNSPASNNNYNGGVLNGKFNPDQTNSRGTTPSVSTSTTGAAEQPHNDVMPSVPSTLMTRSFTPISNFPPKASPRVTDLKKAISGNSLRISSFGNSSIREGGMASSLVSSRIMEDVGSLLADLDVNGDLSSDEEASYSKGRLVH